MEKRALEKSPPSLCLGFTIEILGWNVSEWKVSKKKKSFAHQIFIEGLLGARCVRGTILNKTQPLLSEHVLDSGKRENRHVSSGSKCYAQTNKWGKMKSNKQAEKRGLRNAGIAILKKRGQERPF